MQKIAMHAFYPYNRIVVGQNGDFTLEDYKKWFKKNRVFPLIVLFAATPLPDDIVGVVCGMFNYDLKKFIIASIIGKCAMNLALAWGGFYGIRFILTVFGG